MKTIFNTIYMSVNSHFKSSARAAQGWLKYAMMFVMLLMLGIGQTWGATYSVTVDQNASGNNNVHITTTTKNSSQTVTYNDVLWTFAWAGNGVPNSGNKSQCQFGSGSNPCTSVTINTSGISGTITEVAVTTWGASSNNAEVEVTVGGTNFTNDDNTTVAIGTSSSAKTFTHTGKSGEIVITISQTTSKAIYVSGISVTYSTGPTLYTVTFDANGGSVTPATAIQASAGAAIALPTPTRDGYNCTGWFTATSGGTKRGDAGGSYTPTASETIHAQWTARELTNYRTSCVACTKDPTEGSAELKGGFSLTSVGVTATGWDAGTNCSWDEKGFVWGSSANPTVSNNKVTVNTGTSATWDGALVPSGSTDPTSLSVGNTYHYRAYGKNGKEGATYVYSSDASFTPRSVTCESVTGGTISAGTEVSVSGKTITLTATPDSHFSFGSWTVTNNSTSATITVTNNQFTMPDANVTVTATFNEDAYKTVTFYNNSTNTGITGYTNMKVYVGDTPSEPTLTDGTSGDACDATSDKHYGWSRDTWSDPIDTEAHMTGSPGNHTVYQKGSVPAVVAGDPATISYHAVWAAGSQYWGRLTSSELSGLSAGTELVIVAVDQGYVLKNDLTCSSSVPVETDGKITPTDDIKWALAGSSGAWQLKSGTDILGTLYANCAGSGNGLALNFNTYFQTYSIASSSHGTNEFYIKANDCTEGVLTKVSKYDNFRVVTTSNYSSAASAALKLYIKKGSYSEFITKCCNTPTLAFAASPYAITRQNKDQLNVADVLENISFSSNSSGTITAGTVYKLSSYGSRSTTGGTAAVEAHASFVLDDQTKGHFTVNTNSTSGNGRGTYRIAITQAATDEDHGNYCETTVYAFVDVTLRFLFVDPLNGNANITIDDTGSGITFPTISSWATPDDDACHSEQRVLKGWISEKSLKSLYNSSTRVINLDDIEAADDAASKTGLQRTVVPPGTVMSAGSTLYTQGTKWYAVWAYEK